MKSKKQLRRWWSSEIPNVTIGLDVGDRKSVVCHLDRSAEVTRRGTISTTQAALEQYFGTLPACRVVLEVGTHSPWMSRLLERLGHEVIVANPAQIRSKGRRKNDRIDAEYLARQGRADPHLLYPVRHRGEAAQADLVTITSRDVLVRSRTQLVNHVRGVVKSMGERLPKCSAESFHRSAREHLPQSVRSALEPLLEMIGSLTQQIRRFDRQIERKCEEVYPETAHLRQVAGVGPVTALTYVLVLEDAERFHVRRSVGAYLGLVPGLDDSGGQGKELPISKAGHKLLRKLLLQGAHYVLGPHGPDTNLRRWGFALMERGGGKKAKKRASVAVARKLAVLLHRLWSTGERYEPLFCAREAALV